MTEQQKNDDEAVNEGNQEFQENLDFINEAVAKADTHALIGHIASSLFRIASVQEALYILSAKEVEEQIEAQAASKAEVMAEEIAEDKAKRSYIGKR